MTAADVIIWVGPIPAPLHPRAILVVQVADAGGNEVTMELGDVAPWQPPLLALDRAAAGSVRAGWRRLTEQIDALGIPAGFGARLAGQPLAFPLDAAAAAAGAFARACGRDDAPGAAAAARSLLGLGGGLTPSGDDFVGGALFARHALAAGGAIHARAWRHAAQTILAAAPSQTHPISAALLGDLAAGRGHAPLHDLVHALALEQPGGAVDAARRLVALGHSSGWDILAGLGAGLGIEPADGSGA